MTYERPYHRPVEFKIMCPECGDELHHKCNDSTGSELREAFLKFLSWVPEFHLYPEVQKAMHKAGEKEGWLEKGQEFEKTPFFGTQPWTYAMGDKHFGREFEGVINNIIRSAGFDPGELREASYQRIEQKDLERKKQEEGRAKRKDDIAKAIQLFQSDASLADKTAVLDAIIDAIIEKETRHHHPMEKREDNKVSDPWLYETLDRLKRTYDGGISPTVNKLRIEAARKVAIDMGTISVHLRAADGTETMERYFQTRDEVTKFMTETFEKYDALSENIFASAVYLRVKTRGEWETENFARGPKGWISVPKKAR